MQDRMVQIDAIPLVSQVGPLVVCRDYETVMLGEMRMDLEYIARLQMALDDAVAGIREYRGRQAAGDA
jgi:hypothetical protein